MMVENDQVSNRVTTRSASKRKQLIDSYANRRMTRFASKQQKQQEGEEKPKLPPHKKKRKMQVVDEESLANWRRKLRYLTPEERQTYQKKLKESEGFDVGKYPAEAVFSNHIREISLEKNTQRTEYSTEAAKMAIRKYNSKKHTKFQFVKLVRVGTKLCTGFMYYITFEAKEDEMAPPPPRNFQALVRHFLGTHIEFCREEKKPQLTEGAGETMQQ